MVGVEGVMFKTNTGELSVKAKKFTLLTKSLQPLQDVQLARFTGY